MFFFHIFSKSRNGCLSCFDQAAQCRWPSFREASKLTFASSMKTAAGPLKGHCTTSETPRRANELSKLYISSSCSLFVAPFDLALRSSSISLGASRKSSRFLVGFVSSRRGTLREGCKDEGFDGSCAYSTVLTRKENARRKDGKRGKKKRGEREKVK